jgi:antitoxin component of MazEF toxin-antitoxin module
MITVGTTKTPKLELVRAYSTSSKSKSLAVSIPAAFRDTLNITKDQMLVASMDEEKGQLVYQVVQESELARLVKK